MSFVVLFSTRPAGIIKNKATCFHYHAHSHHASPFGSVTQSSRVQQALLDQHNFVDHLTQISFTLRFASCRVLI